MIPIGCLGADDHQSSGRRPRARPPRSARAASAVHAPRSSNSRWLPTTTRVPSTSASAPSPGSAWNCSTARQRQRLLARARDDRRADRMLGARLERRRQLQDRSRHGAVRATSTSDDAQLALGQRAGLVEGDAADGRQPLQVRAALDQHALARRRGQRRHDRHRRRDHQRARARDDEQHQRAIDPARSSVAPKSSGGTMADRQREDEHGRRVDPREAIDEGLARRALRLRLLHQVDDARERGVAAQPRDPHVERAAAVDRAGEHLVAGALLGGSDSPVTGAWLTWLSPAATRPSSGIFSPGRTTTMSPTADVVHRHAAELARRGVAHERLGGRQIHQRADRAARALHRARLEQLREREQEHDRRPFAPLAEHHRAGDRDQHQHVDVERERARRVQRAADAVDAAADDRQQRRRRPPARWSTPAYSSAMPAPTSTPDAHDEQRAASRPTAPGRPAPRARARRASRSARPLRRSPTVVSFAASYLMLSRWPSTSACERFEPGQPLQPPLEDRHLLVAVHPLDPEDRLGVDLADLRRWPSTRRAPRTTWRSPCWKSSSTC